EGRRVVEEQEDALLPPDAGVVQGSRCPAGPGQQLAVGDPFVAADDRHVVAPALVHLVVQKKADVSVPGVTHMSPIMPDGPTAFPSGRYRGASRTTPPPPPGGGRP